MVYSSVYSNGFSKTAKRPADSGEARGNRRHLLILAESQVLATQVVAPAFRSRGWDVEGTEGIADALKLVEMRRYDLIIMQVMQPGADGFAMCEALRQHSHSPILLIVSPSARTDIIQGFRRGADAYVSEPFDMRELLVRAEALVRRSEGRVSKSTSGVGPP